MVQIHTRVTLKSFLTNRIRFQLIVLHTHMDALDTGELRVANAPAQLPSLRGSRLFLVVRRIGKPNATMIDQVNRL